MQYAYVERGIGSIRRECLDHVVVRNERHLRRILKLCMAYFNRSRTHLSLNKDSPKSRAFWPRSNSKIVCFTEIGG
ncbi:MAG: integrase core domain-containing protein [Alphaproteobacteria bacterium]